MARKPRAKKNQTAATSEILATADIELPNALEDAPQPKDREEEELEKLVFGDLAGFKVGIRAHKEEFEVEDETEDLGVHGDHDAGKGRNLAALQDDELFFIDAGAGGALVSHNDDEDVEMTVAVTGSQKEETPAWEDSDDGKMMISLASHGRMRKLRDTAADDYVTGKEYARRLRRQFERIYPVPDWALPPKRRRLSEPSESESGMEIDDDDDNTPTLSAAPLSALLASSSGFTLPKSSQKTPRLRPEVIDISRLKTGNDAAPSKSAIRCLSFHPSHPLLLTSGLDSTLRLYHIDGETNPLATSLHIRGSALTTSLIHPMGAQIFAAGRRRYFHVWNLESGTVDRVTRVYGHKQFQRSMEHFDISPDGRHIAFVGSKGTVQILDATTNQWVATANVEGRVADISWHPDGETLSIANTVGEVYEYSISSKSFPSVWRDEGGVSLTRITNSPAGARFVAVGSASGIVNIYDRHVSFGGKGPGSLGTPTDPKPVRTVESVVTCISSLEFSKDGQVLCVASKDKRDALKLVHLPSCTIYKNWPTSQTPLGRVTAVKFGGTGGGIMLAVGNEAGRVRLFEIKA